MVGHGKYQFERDSVLLLFFGEVRLFYLWFMRLSTDALADWRGFRGDGPDQRCSREYP